MTTRLVIVLIFAMTASAQSAENFIRYVNPLIGTQKMGLSLIHI
ncbi:MAG: hypothetical protein QUS14_13940 [Pyrinomonadaceae bacterium]|nr:hypothetical protein [Pyrinomonadaceae bacterium]